MTVPALVSREDVVAILAAPGNRPPETVPERIDSLGLAWLIHEAEQSLGIQLDLTDELMERMSTVSSAVEVLRDAQQRSRAVDG
ncbi:MAG: hypothetical protein WCA46_19070 [Actinocatenispora sp.]